MNSIITATSTGVQVTSYNYMSGVLTATSTTTTEYTNYDFNIELFIGYLTLLIFLFGFIWLNIKAFLYGYNTTFTFVKKLLGKE